MSLSPTAAWLAACTKANAELRFLIDIYNGTTTWRCLDGSMDSTSDLYSTQEAAWAVSPVGADLDPFTREVKTKELFIDFMDGFLWPIIVNNRLRGQRVTVHLGERSLSEADFVDFFQGPLEEFEPEPPYTIRASVLDPFLVLENNKIQGAWVGVHPLEALYKGDGSGILEKGGIASFDTTSFDPNTATYDDIGHLLVGRGGSIYAPISAVQSVSEPTPALGLAQDVCRLMNGHLSVNEAGQMEFLRFDSSAAAADNWTVDDIISGSFRQVELDANVVNRICISASMREDGSYANIIVANDAASQAAFAYPGCATRILEEKFETKWVNGVGGLTADINNVVDTFSVFGELQSFAGNRSDAWAAISAGRPAYLLIGDIYHTTADEIVKAEGMARSTYDVRGIEVWDPATGTKTWKGPYARNLTYTSVSRGQRGTANVAHASQGSYVYDITVAVLIADELLARFDYGCHIVELATLFCKYRYQVGDLVTLTYPGFVAYGYDGITSAQKWEIIDREVDKSSKPPCIKWKLAHAGVNTPTITCVGTAPPRGGPDGRRDIAAAGTVTQSVADSGLAGSDSGGLNLGIAAGSATNGTQRALLGSAQAFACPASKDTYVSMDINDGSLNFQSVANGAAAPTIPSSQALICKAVTNAVEITGVTDLRETLPIVGSKLKVGSGPLTNLTTAGVIASAAGLASGIVTSPKIADSAITPIHTDNTQLDAGVLRNGTFTKWRTV